MYMGHQTPRLSSRVDAPVRDGPLVPLHIRTFLTLMRLLHCRLAVRASGGKPNVQHSFAIPLLR